MLKCAAFLFALVAACLVLGAVTETLAYMAGVQ